MRTPKPPAERPGVWFLVRHPGLDPGSIVFLIEGARNVGCRFTPTGLPEGIGVRHDETILKLGVLFGILNMSYGFAQNSFLYGFFRTC